MATEGLFEIALKLFVRKGDDFLVLIAGNTKSGDFPGGRMNPHDSLFNREDSMRREITEELGSNIKLRVSREPLFVFPYRSKNETQEVLGLAHVATFEGGEIKLSDEHIDYFWIPTKEALARYECHFLKGLEKYLTFKDVFVGSNPIVIGEE